MAEYCKKIFFFACFKESCSLCLYIFAKEKIAKWTKLDLFSAKKKLAMQDSYQLLNLYGNFLKQMVFFSVKPKFYTVLKLFPKQKVQCMGGTKKNFFEKQRR